MAGRESHRVRSAPVCCGLSNLKSTFTNGPHAREAKKRAARGSGVAELQFVVGGAGQSVDSHSVAISGVEPFTLNVGEVVAFAFNGLKDIAVPFDAVNAEEGFNVTTYASATPVSVPLLNSFS